MTPAMAQQPTNAPAYFRPTVLSDGPIALENVTFPRCPEIYPCEDSCATRLRSLVLCTHVSLNFLFRPYRVLLYSVCTRLVQYATSVLALMSGVLVLFFVPTGERASRTVHSVFFSRGLIPFCFAGRCWGEWLSGCSVCIPVLSCGFNSKPTISSSAYSAPTCAVVWAVGTPVRSSGGPHEKIVSGWKKKSRSKYRPPAYTSQNCFPPPMK